MLNIASVRVDMNASNRTYELRLLSGIVYMPTRFLSENGQRVYTDSWFTSEVLANALLCQRSMFLTGTYKTGRVPVPLLSKQMKSMKVDEVVSLGNETSGALVILWKDRKMVCICTTTAHGFKKRGLKRRGLKKRDLMKRGLRKRGLRKRGLTERQRVQQKSDRKKGCGIVATEVDFDHAEDAEAGDVQYDGDSDNGVAYVLSRWRLRLLRLIAIGISTFAL